MLSWCVFLLVRLGTTSLILLILDVTGWSIYFFSSSNFNILHSLHSANIVRDLNVLSFLFKWSRWICHNSWSSSSVQCVTIQSTPINLFGLYGCHLDFNIRIIIYLRFVLFHTHCKVTFWQVINLFIHLYS